MKKILFTATAFVLSIVMMPAVSAASDVASVDGTNYATLQEAINNANGKTVTLLSDVTESITISAGNKVTLDLGKFTLTNTSGKDTITNNGELTITGTGTVDNVSNSKAAMVNKGTATLNGATLTRSAEKKGNTYYVLDNNHGTFYMKSGKITNTAISSSCVRNIEATFYMQGGEISNDFIALKNDDNGIIYMTGGVVNSNKTGGSALQNWGTLKMSGGTLNAATGAYALWNLTWSNDYTQTTAVISDNAVINGKVVLSYNDNKPITNTPELTINGGSINGDVVNSTPSELVITAGDINGNISTSGKITVSDADYSKVEELINKANQLDKTLYTEDSIKALEDAINKVDYTKNVLEQDEVDEMASNIEKALNNLVQPSQSTVTNPKTADNILLYVISSIAGLGLATVATKKILQH